MSPTETIAGHVWIRYVPGDWVRQVLAEAGIFKAQVRSVLKAYHGGHKNRTSAAVMQVYGGPTVPATTVEALREVFGDAFEWSGRVCRMLPARSQESYL